MTVVDGRGLTNQKLPAKLNAMLSDPGECIVIGCVYSTVGCSQGYIAHSYIKSAL